MDISLLKNKILVLGRNGTRKIELIRRISKLADGELISKNVNEVEENGVFFMHLNTKYYEATIEFWIDSIPDPEFGKVDPLTEFEELGPYIDAIIYIFDPTIENSFDDISQWESFMKEFPVSVSICITLLTQNINDTFEAYHEWCVENQFEWLVWNPRDFSLECERRVKDALEANLWDGMKQKRVGNLPEPSDNSKMLELLAELSNVAESSTLKESSDVNLEPQDYPSAAEIQLMHTEIFSKIDTDEGLEKAINTLNDLKDRCMKLPYEQRKKIAAQIAISFALELGK